MEYVYGKIYRNGGFHTGYLGFEDGKIEVTGKKNSASIKQKACATGMIIPTFYNAHIHLADAFLYGRFNNTSINELVAPKTGLKIKKLKAASDRTIIDGSKKALETMFRTGTSTFVDFVEMGARGLKLLGRTMKDSPLNCLALGRPSTMRASNSELNEILARSEGFGLSAVSDWPYEQIEKIAQSARKKNKLFAIHASEARRENIKTIVELEPDFIVHLLEATKKDFELIADQNIPVMVCPRANMFFGKYPDITGMINSDLLLALGTDNAMLAVPDMLDELAFAFRIAKRTGGISSQDMMKIAFENPRKIFEPEHDDPSDPLRTGNDANFIVLDVPKLYSYSHPENLLCLGISSAQINLISVNKFICEGLNNNK